MIKINPWKKGLLLSELFKYGTEVFLLSTLDYKVKMQTKNLRLCKKDFDL